VKHLRHIFFTANTKIKNTPKIYFQITKFASSGCGWRRIRRAAQRWEVRNQPWIFSHNCWAKAVARRWDWVLEISSNFTDLWVWKSTKDAFFVVPLFQKITSFMMSFEFRMGWCKINFKKYINIILIYF
jgi:hypothetical protein